MTLPTILESWFYFAERRAKAQAEERSVLLRQATEAGSLKFRKAEYLYENDRGDLVSREFLMFAPDEAVNRFIRRRFSYTLSEVTCAVEVDEDTGEVEVLSFEYNGKRYEEQNEN